MEATDSLLSSSQFGSLSRVLFCDERARQVQKVARDAEVNEVLDMLVAPQTQHVDRMLACCCCVHRALNRRLLTSPRAVQVTALLFSPVARCVPTCTQRQVRHYGGGTFDFPRRVLLVTVLGE